MSDSKLKRLSPPRLAKREPLNARKKGIVFTQLMRDKSFFESSMTQIDAARDLVGEENRRFAMIWLSLQALYERFEKLPSYEGLLAEIEERLGEEDDYLDEEEEKELSGLLVRAYDKSKRQLNETRPEAKEYLRHLLHEGLQHQINRAVEEPGQIVGDLPSFLTSMHERAAAIDTIHVGAIRDLWDDSNEVPINKVSTGCVFFDEYMGGGHAEGEVYGLMAPWGVGKTTLACQLGANRCMQLQAIWNKTGRVNPLPVVYMVFYEEPRNSVRVRLESYAGQIDRKILEERRFKDFSSRAEGNYKDYEIKMWGPAMENGFKPPGEKERYATAVRQLRRNIQVINFTGDDPAYRVHAATMTDGIRAIIDEDQRSRKNPGVGGVIIDYAGAAAVRHLDANSHKEASKEMRHLIGRMPLAVKNKIAAYYKTHAWLIHQLSADANSRAPGTAMKITDAAEARNFPEHCDFAFLVGTKTDDHLAVLSAAKQRREEKKRDCVIRIDGRFSAVRATDKEFMIENNRIISAKEFGRVADLADADDDQEFSQEMNYKDIT